MVAAWTDAMCFGLCRKFEAYIGGATIFATVMEANTSMPAKPRLYLDHAATTPVIPAARTAMTQAMEHWANPSSPHGEGRAAKAALEDARARIAGALGWGGEVIFTSGASEALGISMWRAQADATWISTVEHDAVQRASKAGYDMPVGTNGIVDKSTLNELLGKNDAITPLVVIQSANNETGVLQPLGEISAVVREHNGILLADCSQSAGKLPLPDADLITVSAHKLGGPPGIGALLVRDLAQLSPTGGQEKGYRGGTENLPAIMGFAAALEAGFGWMERAATLRADFDAAIIASGGEVVAQHTPRIATIASYRMPGISAASQLIGFDIAGIAVSAGSACSSGTLKTSHVLGAMGWNIKEAGEVIRVSFGPETQGNDIERFVAAWQAIAIRVKAA
jgi:cysteine desulfurase